MPLLPLKALAAPGLLAVVTHQWLEAFVAGTVAAAAPQKRPKPWHGGKGKGKGGAHVTADVALPALAE